MTDKTTTTAGQQGAETVTEEDLMKSLNDLEGKKPEEPAKKEPVVTTAGLSKSTTDAVNGGASAELKKALDVSSVLSEVVNLLGAHTDNALETLSKSIQGAAERDLKVIAILGELKKSIDANTAAIQAFGNTPGGKPQSQTTAASTKVEVLQKSTTTADGGAGDQDKGKLGRREVLTVLEDLAKSATAGSADQQRWIRAASTFESTGQINNPDLLAVKQKLGKAAA